MNAEARLEEHRAGLTGHCYRMLGSAAEADDAVQETMLRAWRGLERFEARASLKTWLYRIATNVCLDALADRKRRILPYDDETQKNATGGALPQFERAHWIEPLPDWRAIPERTDPAEHVSLRQSIRLAFVSALQSLPPKQRAALLLVEVVGCSATEAAECLETTVASVNSALQRARTTLASRGVERPEERLAERESELLRRYVDAFERQDIDHLVTLLREDATHCMPPYALWLRGTEAIRAWMLERGADCRGSKLVPTRANGMPAFGQYRRSGEGFTPWALIVLELTGDRIATVHNFLDTKTLFPLFGLGPTPEA